MALDLALTVAAGLPWNGEETRSGFVVYLAAEGADHVLRRADAWCAMHGLSDVPDWFRWIDQPVMLNDAHEQAGLIADLRTLPEPPVLVVVDTYARCLAGNENATEDAAAAVRALDRMRVEFGCARLVIHHTALDHPDRERGSTVLGDAADVRITLKRDAGSYSVRVVCGRVKDEAPFDPIPLTLQPFHDSLVVTRGEALPEREPFQTTKAPPAAIAAWVREQPDGIATPKDIYERWGSHRRRSRIAESSSGNPGSLCGS